MAGRHVHWAADVPPDEEGDRDFFVPPTPRQLASRLLPDTDDEDSLADSPSPPTPLTALAPITAHTDPYHTRHRSRATPAPIIVPLHPFADPRVRSPDGMSWRYGEPSPSSDRFRMAGMDRPLQPLSAPGPSPRKPAAPSLPNRSRRSSVSGPLLHLVLGSTSTPSAPALVWNVGDVPSSSKVLMTTPNDGPPVQVPSEILNAPATRPPQREMRISCVGHFLWEPLVVRPDGSRTPQDPSRDGRATPRPTTPRGQATPDPSSYVTVMDVINAIYRYLHIRMDSKEYAALKSLPAKDMQTAVARAFYERCDAEEHRSTVQRASPERGNNSPASFPRSRVGAGASASNARTGGLRRLDCLLGQTRFLGLDNVPGNINEWYMRVAPPR